MNKVPQDRLAKLYVPTNAEGLAAFDWRLRLIEEQGIFDRKELLLILQKNQTDRLQESEINKFTDYALSKDIVPDEYEKTVLFVTRLLIGAKNLPASEVLSLDQNFLMSEVDKSISKKAFLAENPDYLPMLRKNFIKLGKSYVKHKVSKIRAKFAFQEIVCFFSPTQIVPTLVQQSASYLQCNFVKNWLYFHQLNVANKTKDHLKSFACLNAFNKALKGDERKAQFRKYKYWAISWVYEDISARISQFRYARKNRCFDNSFFKDYCDIYKIHERFRNRMLDPKDAVKTLTLEIMQSQKLIDDPKAFHDFNPKVNKLLKKHEGGKYMSIMHEMHPILMRFFDFPTKYPDIYRRFDPAEVLGQVRL